VLQVALAAKLELGGGCSQAPAWERETRAKLELGSERQEQSWSLGARDKSKAGAWERETRAKLELGSKGKRGSEGKRIVNFK